MCGCQSLPRHHASHRVATAMSLAISAEEDPNTLKKWSQAAGASQATLRSWCFMAHVRPKEALDFTRVLRAIVLNQNFRWDLFEVFDVSDPRTLERLLHRGGVEFLLSCDVAPPPERFLAAQCYVRNQHVLETLRAMLGQTPAVVYRFAGGRSDSYST